MNVENLTRRMGKILWKDWSRFGPSAQLNVNIRDQEANECSNIRDIVGLMSGLDVNMVLWSPPGPS